MPMPRLSTAVKMNNFYFCRHKFSRHKSLRRICDIIPNWQTVPVALKCQIQYILVPPSQPRSLCIQDVDEPRLKVLLSPRTQIQYGNPCIKVRCRYLAKQLVRPWDAVINSGQWVMKRKLHQESNVTENCNVEIKIEDATDIFRKQRCSKQSVESRFSHMIRD